MSQASASPALEHVIITGAASGIGKACASKLRSRGTRVTALDIVKPDIAVDNYYKLDLSNSSSIDKVVSQLRDTSPANALLNIAGVPPRPAHQLSILNINWLGQRQLTEGLLDCLKPGSSIVNMASRAGHAWRENINQVKEVMAIRSPESLATFVQLNAIDATRAYNLSKEAMIVWTLSSTAALKARQLRINSVSPAAVDTAILDDFITAFGATVENNLARVGRAGQPDEVADVTIFLASPESHWLRGIDIVVDGGMGAMIQTEMLELDQPHSHD